MKYNQLSSYLSSGQNDKAKSEFLASVNGKVTESNLLKDNLLKAAIVANNLVAIRFLINSCSVDVNWKLDSFGNRCLHFATDQVTAQMLIKAGADFTLPGAQQRLPLHISKNAVLAKLFCSTEIINALDISGNTPLHMAALDGRNDVLKFLLENNADAKLLNKNKQTALHLAATSAEATLLIDAGIDVDAKDIKGRTSLHLSKSADLTAYLLKNGADIEKEDNLEQTPLHYAMDSYSKKTVARVLIESDADIYARDIYGKLPVHKIKSLEIGKLLFRFFPEFKNAVDIKDNAGKTPLQYALTKGQKSLAIFCPFRS